MTRGVLLTFVVVCAAACAHSPPSQLTNAQTLVFIDASAFDRQLSSRLREAEGALEVNVPFAFHVNDMPDRIDKWLGTVAAGGGALDLDPIDEGPTRGVVSEVVDVATLVHGAVRRQRLYRPARRCDVALKVTPDGEVTTIVFTPR